VTSDVKQEFLKFHNLSPDTAARFPPPVWIKARVARGSNQNSEAIAAHRSTKHSAQTPRMISIGHHHDGAILVPGAPLEQDLTLGLCSSDGSRDWLNRLHAKRPE
jgi:hypothetical protein